MTTGRQNPSFRAITDAQVRNPDQLATLLNGFLKDSGNALQQVRPFVVRDVTVTIPERWTDLSLLNDWSVYDGVNFFTPGYWKDPSGIVHLRGAAGGGTYDIGSPIASLPASYAPALRAGFAVVQSNATFEPAGEVFIYASGDIVAPEITSVQSGVSTFLCFDGISFEAEDRSPGPTLSDFIDVSTRGLPLPPTDVTVTDCYEVTSNTPFPYPALAWQAGGQTVTLTQIAGLPPGTYALRLLIVAG